MSETIKITGNVKIEIIDVKTKKVVDVKHFKNIIVNTGLQLFQAWLAGIPPADEPDYNVDTRITHIALGDDNTTPNATQTDLGNEIIRKELYPTPDPNCEINKISNNQVDYVILIDETEANGEILREMALFSTTFTDFMVTRLLIGNLTKSSSVQFRITYSIIISST